MGDARAGPLWGHEWEGAAVIVAGPSNTIIIIITIISFMKDNLF